MYLPKNVLKAGIIGIAVYAIYKIASKANAVGKLEFKLLKINYSFSTTELILTCLVSASNTVSETILLNSFDVDLLLNSQKIGNSVNSLQITLPENGNKILPISFSVQYLPMVKVLQDIMSGSFKGNSLFQIIGNATIENVKFPVNLKLTLS